MYLLFHPLVSKRFTYPEPQMLLSRMNLLKCTKMLSNSICVFISHALHFSQRDAVCTSTRINFLPTSTLFIGGRGGWCPISGQLSMGLFSSSVKRSGLFAIKRLRRLIRKAALVSLAPFGNLKEHCWVALPFSLQMTPHVPLQASQAQLLTVQFHQGSHNVIYFLKYDVCMC